MDQSKLDSMLVKDLAVVFSNQLGQRIGEDLSAREVPLLPSREPMVGNLCKLEAIDVGLHSSDLFDVFSLDLEGRDWTYMSHGPFSRLSDFQAWMKGYCLSKDPLFYAVVDGETGRAVGMASYLRINPQSGSIEVGSIHFSQLMKVKPIATEAMYLMMKRAFEAGYRRYEWKCNAFNVPSCRAAERLGFSYEGTFRNHMIVKGRNRDTAWFSILEEEWPPLRDAFETWLSPSNFSETGQQRKRLSALTKSIPVNRMGEE